MSEQPAGATYWALSLINIVLCSGQMLRVSRCTITSLLSIFRCPHAAILGPIPWVRVGPLRPKWTGPEEPGAPSSSAGLTTKGSNKQREDVLFYRDVSV
jgi:hypothetical protein